MAAERITVKLQDVRTNIIYSVALSIDEAKKVQTDEDFARTVLARVQGSTLVYDENTEPNTFGEGTSERAQEEIEAYRWPHEAVLLLLEEYGNFEHRMDKGKMPQKKLWAQIAHKLNLKGHNVTGPQCQSKFGGLKRTYKSIKDHNNKSGNDPRAWNYYTIMDEMLARKPFMAPAATISSTGKRTREASEGSTSSNEAPQLDGEKQSKRRRTPEELFNEFKLEKSRAEEAAERRHQENMQIKERMLQALERLIGVLEKQ